MIVTYTGALTNVPFDVILWCATIEIKEADRFSPAFRENNLFLWVSKKLLMFNGVPLSKSRKLLILNAVCFKLLRKLMLKTNEFRRITL